jgi:hypothetical protein
LTDNKLPDVLEPRAAANIYREGVTAFRDGLQFHENPHAKAGESGVTDAEYQKGVEWRSGWNAQALAMRGAGHDIIITGGVARCICDAGWQHELAGVGEEAQREAWRAWVSHGVALGGDKKPVLMVCNFCKAEQRDRALTVMFRHDRVLVPGCEACSVPPSAKPGTRVRFAAWDRQGADPVAADRHLGRGAVYTVRRTRPWQHGCDVELVEEEGTFNLFLFTPESYVRPLTGGVPPG